MEIYIITVEDRDGLYIVGAYTDYEAAVAQYDKTCEREDENDNFGNEVCLIEVIGTKKTTLETYTCEGCDDLDEDEE